MEQSVRRQPAYYVHRRRRRDEVRQEIRETISELKGWTCFMCDLTVEDQRQLHFHHVRGPKLFNVSHAIRMRTPIPKLISEIDKCIPICIWCHNSIPKEDHIAS